jgi:protein translocase SEC61 complex gamma subunit
MSFSLLSLLSLLVLPLLLSSTSSVYTTNHFIYSKPDKREFLKISQAVGVGFLVMGVIGYIVKLSTLIFWKEEG